MLAALFGGAGAKRIETMPGALITTKRIPRFAGCSCPASSTPDEVRITRGSVHPFARESYSYVQEPGTSVRGPPSG